jgi:hypothetical protein
MQQKLRKRSNWFRNDIARLISALLDKHGTT